ncbi:uncharacterized protein LOC111484388 isoform X2 [Cucurbita maxima]|uniref:Uncharacterized protein LOC111484388 isoform X2 n=1 Tax=Cucurbita maxima TaxID=3661 RepID=A0A6J1JHD6_CUCMA|nr:uncharacterized protein LOC111484388 isoform X2 [Cucurbita maxima]
MQVLEILIHAETRIRSPKSMPIKNIGPVSTRNHLLPKRTRLIEVPPTPVSNQSYLRRLQKARNGEERRRREERREHFLGRDCNTSGTQSITENRSIKINISFSTCTDPINVHPYQYLHTQKGETECMIADMLDAGIIQINEMVNPPVGWLIPNSSSALLSTSKNEGWNITKSKCK